jgi:hypothetical protein
MPSVTRAAIWPYAGDYPYVDLEVKGVQTFMWFSKQLEYFVPRKKHFLWPGNAKDDGIDTRTHSYEWWLVFDGKNAISCTNKQIHGIEYTIYNAEANTATSMQVTEAEAHEIKAAVERMVKDVKEFKKGEPGFFKPPNTVSTYPVKSLLYTHNQPKKGPIMPGYGLKFSLDAPSMD